MDERAGRRVDVQFRVKILGQPNTEHVTLCEFVHMSWDRALFLQRMPVIKMLYVNATTVKFSHSYLYQSLQRMEMSQNQVTEL
jgi:hypothetical protein